MIIGVPEEIKIREKRVAMTPAGVHALTGLGHTVLIENEAGIGSGISDEQYEKAGAEIVKTAADLWSRSDMIIKVKEPVGPELGMLRKDQILFTYLHLAADEKLTRTLLERKTIGIAYETIQHENGALPLLAPMSEVAGRLSLQMGCAALEAKNGGKGLLLSGVPGVAPGIVTVLGGGTAGTSAALVASGIGADVRILDISIERLRYISDIFNSRVTPLMSDALNIEKCVRESDLIIGAVLIPGSKAPKLLDRGLISSMQQGSAFVDISIDQGGCSETSRPTTHDNPMYAEYGVVHYCVTNMPGAVPRTSTFALTNATLPYIIAIAEKGYQKAIKEDRTLAKGLNTHLGTLTCREVGESLSIDWEKIYF
jgi:alanine dehydrogenase